MRLEFGLVRIWSEIAGAWQMHSTKLAEEIVNAQKHVRTDAYQMSVGEIVNMYTEGEIAIAREFQRLFRWDTRRKSKLIGSLLLGIPLSPIFVFEREDGAWELIDGLQRVSTILEFMGRLQDPDGDIFPPSYLEATEYLPSLHNAVWKESDLILNVPVNEQAPLDKAQQFAIRCGRMDVEILKRPSDDETKYDLFRRLNSGGTPTNAQELRNCIMLMVCPDYFRAIKAAAKDDSFQSVTSLAENKEQNQRHMEYAIRFLVHANIKHEGRQDVEDYIDSGIIELARNGDYESDASQIRSVFQLLDDVAGKNALHRHENVQHVGKIGLVALEVIAVGIAKNLDAILGLGRDKAKNFVKDKIENFWRSPECVEFSAHELRETSRIQRTVPFGAEWFKP